MPPTTASDAASSIDVEADPQRVYELISDPGTLAELAAEYSSFRWLNGAMRATVGARFKGGNKNGWRRWSTVATITDAAAGERFAFDVTVEAGPLSVAGARWQYDIAPTDTGCTVTESTWDQRAPWAKTLGNIASGVTDRADHNRRNIDATLRAIKQRAEQTPRP